jgi:hypothetical protein
VAECVDVGRGVVGGDDDLGVEGLLPFRSVCVHDLPQDLDRRKEGMELRLSRERLAEIDDSAGHQSSLQGELT